MKLRNTVFNFCYENIADYPGYVSEKIWDAISSGCIPIYWPSWEIPDNYIPKWAYIDASKYASVNELVNYLESIETSDLLTWQQKLLKLAEQKVSFMSSENYVNLISSQIARSLD